MIELDLESIQAVSDTTLRIKAIAKELDGEKLSYPLELDFDLQPHIHIVSVSPIFIEEGEANVEINVDFDPETVDKAIFDALAAKALEQYGLVLEIPNEV